MKPSCRRAGLLLTAITFICLLATPAGAQVTVPPAPAAVEDAVGQVAGHVDRVNGAVDPVTGQSGTQVPDVPDAPVPGVPDVPDVQDLPDVVDGAVDDLTGTATNPAVPGADDPAAGPSTPANPDATQATTDDPTDAQPSGVFSSPDPDRSSTVRPTVIVARTPSVALGSRQAEAVARQDPTEMVGDDLANFGLPLLMTLAFIVFLAVEGRFSGEPSKLADAHLATRRPLRFER